MACHYFTLLNRTFDWLYKTSNTEINWPLMLNGIYYTPAKEVGASKFRRYCVCPVCTMPFKSCRDFFSLHFLQINADFSFCQRLLSLNDKVVLPVERRSILARCWAPGSERSFRSYLMSWESAVVTDLSP